MHRLRDGDRGSHRAALTRWLLVRGRGTKPLDRRVSTEAIRAHSSSKRPSVQRGELAVLYAAVWQAVFGVVEVVGDPEHDPERERWSWRFAIRPLVVIEDLHDAPPVEAIGVFPQSLWRHSHIRLTDEQFAAAEAAIEAAAGAPVGESAHNLHVSETDRPYPRTNPPPWVGAARVNKNKEKIGPRGAVDPKRIVAKGYDAIAERYAEWAASFVTPALRWVEELLALLPEPADVLDLGCGRGVPFTRILAERHRVTGIDISERQVELASWLVPNASFVHADATTVEFPARSFDAVVSLFMLGHVPRGEQGPLLARIASWLRPNGLLLATMGTANAEDVDPDWLGAPMFFSSHDPETNRRLLDVAGFELLRDRVISHHEPGHGDVSFMWVLARRR